MRLPDVLLPLLPLVTVLGCIFGGWVARGMWEREKYQRDVLNGRAPAPWELGMPVYRVNEDERVTRIGWTSYHPSDEIPADGYARRGVFDFDSDTYV